MRAYVRCGGNGGVVGASCARSIGRCPGEWATRAAAGPLRCVSRPAARRGVGCVAGARVGTRTWGHTRPHGHVGTHMSGDTRWGGHVGTRTPERTRRDTRAVTHMSEPTCRVGRVGTHTSGRARRRACRDAPVRASMLGYAHRDAPVGRICQDAHLAMHPSKRARRAASASAYGWMRVAVRARRHGTRMQQIHRGNVSRARNQPPNPPRERRRP